MSAPKTSLKLKILEKKLQRTSAALRDDALYRSGIKDGEQSAQELLQAVRERNMPVLIEKMAMFRKIMEKFQTGPERESCRNIYSIALVLAATLGFQDVVELFLKDKDIDINGRNRMQDTALMAAAYKGHIKLCGFLLSKGADPNQTNMYGSSALDYAARIGKTDTENTIPEQNRNDVYFGIVQFLLSKKADPNNRSKDGLTPLMWAAQFGHFKIANALLNAGANPNYEDKNGTIAAMAAILAGNKSFLELYLKHPSVNINAANKNGTTLLMFAAECNSIELMSLLIQNGAKGFDSHFIHELTSANRIDILEILIKEKLVNAETLCDDKGNTLLLLACTIGNFPLTKLLLDLESTNIEHPNNKGATALMVAAHLGHQQCFQLLLEKGANINATSINGDTTLIAAIEQNDINSIKQLLAVKNIDINATPHVHGNNALHIAICRKNYQCVKLLLDNGASTQINVNGITTLMLASQQGDPEILKLILAAKQTLDINEVDPIGLSALSWAVQNGHKEAVAVLLKAGASPNCVDIFNSTPIMTAAYFGYTEILKLLIQKGASVNEATPNGCTALIYACYNGQAPAVKLLLDNGADDKAKINDSVDALVIAISQNHLECIKLLLTPAKLDILLKDISEQQKMFSCIKTSAMAELIRSYGLNGNPIQCQMALMNAFLGEPDPTLSDYIAAIDLKTQVKVKTIGSEGVQKNEHSPLFLYSNYSNKETRLIVLKELLKSLNILDMSRINTLAGLLSENTIDFQYAEDASLCISLERNKRIYQLTLSLNNVPLLLAKGNSSYKYTFKDKLWELSAEYKELKEDEELQSLKDNVFTLLSKFANQLYKDESLLKKMAELIRQKQNKDELNLIPKIEELTNLNLSSKQKLQDFRDYLGSIKFTSSQEKSDIDLPLFNINKITDEYKLKISVQIAELQNTLASLQEVELQATPKSRTKKSRSRKKEKNKEKDKEKQLHEKQDMAEKGRMVANFDMPRIETTNLNLPSLDKEIELQKKELQENKPKVIPKKQPSFPSKNVSLEDLPKHNYDYDIRQHLRIPKFTFEAATKLHAHLKADEGRNTLKTISKNLDVKATGEDLLIGYNAALAGLALALETRKGLQEEWPNHVRNIIFRHESAFRKLHGESELIAIIQQIYHNLEKISESELMKNKGKLLISNIDSKDFIKTIMTLQVPKFSLETALIYINQSEIELAYLKQQILNPNVNMNNLRMAIGFSLARIGTYFNDIQKHSSEFVSEIQLKSKYFKYIPFGKEFRHHDIAWQKGVNDFIANCFFNDDEEKPISNQRQNPKSNGFLPTYSNVRNNFINSEQMVISQRQTFPLRS